MTIVYISNYINHHQVPVSDELYHLTNGNYNFVELSPMPEGLTRCGYPDFSSRPYLIQAWKSQTALEDAWKLCLEADVVLFGGHEALKFQVARARMDKLSFDVSERWLKKGLLNLCSPRLLSNLWYSYTLFNKKNIYKLCASAFAAKDQYFLNTYRNKCFKWGYFTKVDKLSLKERDRENSGHGNELRFMWCARFLKWKHPELPVKLARRLKMRGYKFSIDMFGSGEELEKIRMMAREYEVHDVVNFCGNRPNDEILEEMRLHDIFLFTSDRNEGWGAVANEAMSNGCVLVGSDAIGSIPFLLEDGENGCVFKSCDLDSLQQKVEFLLNCPEERKRLSINAYNTITNIWSPQNAARNLLTLIDDLFAGREISIVEGPCSKALPL